jgi:hypothetical protein
MPFLEKRQKENLSGGGQVLHIGVGIFVMGFTKILIYFGGVK